MNEINVRDNTKGTQVPKEGTREVTGVRLIQTKGTGIVTKDIIPLTRLTGTGTGIGKGKGIGMKGTRTRDVNKRMVVDDRTHQET